MFIGETQMEFKVTMRSNPKDETGTKKFHPFPAYSGTKTLTDIAKDISYSTTLTPVDVKAVIEALVVVLEKELLNGTKIKIDHFGIFKVSFGGTGHENPDEVTVKDIGGVKIVFIPDPELRKRIKAFITFEKVKKEKQRQEDAGEAQE